MCPALVSSTILHVSALAPNWLFQHYYILTKLFLAYVLNHIASNSVLQKC